MDGVEPAIVFRLLQREAGDGFPTRTDGDVITLCIHDPGSLRVEFYRVAIVVFALAQSFFLLFHRRDIGDGNANSQNFASLIAHRLVGHHQGLRRFTNLRRRYLHLNARERLSAQRALEVWLELFIDSWRNYIGNFTPQVSLHTLSIHLRELLIQIYIVKIAVDEGEANGSAIVDGAQLRKPCGGMCVE